jgi:DNA repair protein RadD
VKLCPNCHELVHPSVRQCPACGFNFPFAQKKLELRHDDIMGLDGNEMKVTDWFWRKHISRASGKEMLAVSYYGGLSDPTITEYFPVTHDGYAGEKARRTVLLLIKNRLVNGYNYFTGDLADAADRFNENTDHPTTIKYEKDGKFFRVTNRSWE